MKPQSIWLWRIARASFAASLLVFASPTIASVAAVSVGDVQFSWGHVLVLIAAGAVWGDARTNRLRDREEQKRDRDELRAEVREFRTELKEIWDELRRDR